MNRLFQVTNYIRYGASSKIVLSAVFLCALVGAIGITMEAHVLPAQAAACNSTNHPNDIIPCGGSSAADFAAKYHQNTSGDLPAVYARYNLSAANVSALGMHAVNGLAYKDNTVRVGGQIVATNAHSLGRVHKNGDTAVTIGSKTYWDGPNSTAFASDALPVFVLMNGDQFVAGVLKDCFNPIVGTPKPKPPVPTFICKLLTATPIQGSRTNYSFRVEAPVSGGAKVNHFVYDFGDGAMQTTTAASTTHNYVKTGTFTARVTAFVAVNGATKSVTSAQCATPITVKPLAAFQCVDLTFSKIERTKFHFVATTSASGGASLKNADFDFGDGQTAKGIAPTAANQVVIDHTFSQAKDYTITATVYPNNGGAIKSDTCTVAITVVPETCADHPNTPECQPPQFCKENIPVGDQRCKEAPPETIASTGPADIISGGLGVGSITGAGYYWLRSRRNLIDTLLGR